MSQLNIIDGHLYPPAPFARLSPTPIASSATLRKLIYASEFF